MADVAKNNFIYMLVALLVFLLAQPIALDAGLLPPAIARLVASLCLFLIGIWSLRGMGKWFAPGLTLAAIGVSLGIATLVIGEPRYQLAIILSLMGFLGLSAVAAIRQVLFYLHNGTNRLTGALCVYLLLGTIWSLAYELVEFLAPGSFNIAAVGIPQDHSTQWLYYSFVTLTTLGYGDITPISNTARVLTYTEAIVGVSYLAVMVAGLVGAHVAEESARDRKGDR